MVKGDRHWYTSGQPNGSFRIAGRSNDLEWNININQCVCLSLSLHRFKDGEQLVPDGKHYSVVTVDEGEVRLVIHEATIEDDAEYTCTAENHAGSVSTTAEILVNPAGG